MDGVQFAESGDANESSRAKRLCISIEPLPDRRIYRLDDRGVETYDDEQAPDEKLKFLAQLIHEPERPAADTGRQTIERALGTAIDQFTRLKNIAAKLANPDSEFALGQVEAPLPSPEDAEIIAMAAYQSRHQQLKGASDLLTGVLGRLRQTVQHQRGFHEDFQTLTRSRWRLNSPDQDWRPDVWYEPLNVIVKRLSNTFRSLELFRSSEGTLHAMYLHQLSGTSVRIEAHNMNHSSPQLYYSTGVRGDISDLYRPLSNTYFARNASDIHRLWLWVTKSIEDQILWLSIKKAAAIEGLEIRDDEVILQMPDSPQVFSVRALRPKQTVPTTSTTNTTSASNSNSTTATLTTQTQPDTTTVLPAEPSSASAMEVEEMPQDLAKESNTKAPVASTGENPMTPFSSSVQANRKATYHLMRNRLNEAINQTDKPSYNDMAATSLLDSFDPLDLEDPSPSDHSNFESDFDVSLTQDLIMLTLKQATIIQQHGSMLDQNRFPLFPVRRLAHPIIHQSLTPALRVAHHFRQLLEFSRTVDDITLAIARTTGLGALDVHFEPSRLATVSTLHISFCTLKNVYSIKDGEFEASPLQTLSSVVEFTQFLLRGLANYILESVAQHTQALTGSGTATSTSQSVTFPLGLSHPLTANKAQKPQHQLANFFATFELLADSPLGLSPVLKVHPRIQGMPVSAFKYPLETNIWHDLKGSNFVDKLTTLLLSTR